MCSTSPEGGAILTFDILSTSRLRCAACSLACLSPACVLVLQSGHQTRVPSSVLSRQGHVMQRRCVPPSKFQSVSQSAETKSTDLNWLGLYSRDSDADIISMPGLERGTPCKGRVPFPSCYRQRPKGSLWMYDLDPASCCKTLTSGMTLQACMSASIYTVVYTGLYLTNYGNISSTSANLSI